MAAKLVRKLTTAILSMLAFVLALTVNPGGDAGIAYASPAITIADPLDGAVVGPETMRISGTYAGLYDIRLYIGGLQQAAAVLDNPDSDAGGWHYDLDTTGYSGEVQLLARGLDKTTRYGIWSETVTITVNNPAAARPEVRIVSPVEGTPLSGTIPVRVTVSPSASTAAVNVRIDGGAWQTAVLEQNGSAYTVTWDTYNLGDKTSSIEARAVNALGAETRSRTVYAQVGAGTHETVVVPKTDRAMWIWEAASYSMLLNPGSRQVLDALASDTTTFGSDPVTTLYFAVGPYSGMDVMEDAPSLLRDFISWAHDRGYRVYACIAGGTSPPYMGAFEVFHDVALRHFEQVLNYNVGSPHEARFDGINVDIEPYISPQFAENAPSLQLQYLDLLGKMAERRNAAGLNLPIGPAIPKWYDTSAAAANITWNSQTKWLSEHVQDVSDYISIMDYRDTADGSAGIIAGAEGEIAYGEAIGKPNSVVIGVETLDIASSGDPEQITFREEGRAVMETELDKVYAAFGARPSFGGIAMHHYDSIRWLPSNWGPDGSWWQPPADTEPPGPVSSPPVATALDYQSVRIGYGRASDNTDVEGYLVYRDTTPSFTPRPDLIAGKSRTLSFQDIGLLPSTTYYYKVAAIDLRGNIGPVSAETSATTGATALKPMIVSTMGVARSGDNAVVTLRVSDRQTMQPLPAEVGGRFTYAGGLYGTAKADAEGFVSIVSEKITTGYQVGFEPRRIEASGYYWAQAYDTPHRAAAIPKAKLNGLGLSTGTLTVPFASGTSGYTAIVPASATSVRVTPAAADSGTAIRVNGTPVASGSESADIPLHEGANRIVVQLWTADGDSDSVYTIAINRYPAIGNTFEPADDTFVYQNGPAQNFGTEPYLDVYDRTNAAGGGDRMVYLKFDLSRYGEAVQTATLYVYAASAPPGPVELTVAGYDNDAWSETTMNWNNRLTGPMHPVGTLIVDRAGWHRVDATAFVQSQTDGKASFRIMDNTTSETLLQFHSKEHAVNHPYLLLNEPVP
ncbi:DNRLRE domain-containing protein [Paenibacillus hodogayensis]|uniref:DNRLRE domain-containing protein n=1 Tax=Paenibacillus hodogayensis TaxID=279208 RepID=A0ABV5VR63_9BACL